MKKLLILLFSILLSFNSYGGLFDKTVCIETDAQERDGLIYLPNKTKPFSGKNLCLHEDSQKKSQGKIKDGKIEGKWTVWYESGKKESEGKYKNGKENGKWIWWYKNTQKEREAKYKDGKLDGKSIMWHENGKIRKPICVETDAKIRDDLIYLRNESKPYTGENFCKLGKYGGDWKSFLYDVFISEGEIINGKYVNQIRSYYYRGQLINEIASTTSHSEISDGKHMITFWYKNGQKRTEVNNKNGWTYDGSSTFWHENGQIERKENYIDDELDGKRTYWNENGQIESEANWKDGECISGDCD